MSSRAVDTVKYARHLTGVGRNAASHVGAGLEGTWKATLAIGGLSDERREELVAAMEVELGTPRQEPVGDGLLRVIGWLNPGLSLQVGATHAIGQWTQLMQRIGLKPSELLAGDVELIIEPYDIDTTDVPVNTTQQAAPNVVGRTIGRMLPKSTARRLANFQHGLGVAHADNFDLTAMKATGERTFAVGLCISELNENEKADLADRWRTLMGTDMAADEDGDLTVVVGCEQVGTGVGAVMLFLRKAAQFFEYIPAHAALMLLTADRTDDDA